MIMATYIDTISVPVTYIEIALADLGQAKREVILQACWWWVTNVEWPSLELLSVELCVHWLLEAHNLCLGLLGRRRQMHVLIWEDLKPGVHCQADISATSFILTLWSVKLQLFSGHLSLTKINCTSLPVRVVLLSFLFDEWEKYWTTKEESNR